MHNFLSSTSILALGAMSVIPQTFANTHAGSTFHICATEQPADLDETAFALLTFVEVKGVGAVGEAGSSTNILTYDEWGTGVIQKAKGITDAGSPELETSRIPTDPGQILMYAAAATNFNYAFKIEKNDKATGGGTPTIIYNRGIVTGPKRPQGRNEDFDLEVWMLGFNQLEVVVDPT